MTNEEVRERLAANWEAVRLGIYRACTAVGRSPSEVTLVAVSKTVAPRVIREAFALGLTDFGENRPQALWAKAEELADLPLRWHMIGHLQSNKLDRTVPLCYLIHSIDRMSLLNELQKLSKKNGWRPKVLLQINASREEQKGGFSFDETPGLEGVLSQGPLQVAGLMGMAALTDNPEETRRTFAELKRLQTQLQHGWPALGAQVRELSMGMSGDYEIAIQEGATIIRVGSSLFAGLDEVDQ
jgi:pyridoxal phosphate enzyme (YggS family)